MAGCGPLGTDTNNEAVDFQIMARTPHRPPVPHNGQVQPLVEASLADSTSGAGWRLAFLLEYAGTYRELYAMEAEELKGLQEKLPKAELEKLRAALKTKYQGKTPPEVEKVLKAIFGERYSAKTPTGSHNPAKTNTAANISGKVAKHVGRVFIVLMVYSEYKKIHEAEDWCRQLGASSSGFLGSVATGAGFATGLATGLKYGLKTKNPWAIVGATLAGGLVGGIIGYKLFSGTFELLYDIFIE
jgi:hypothetical protein